MIAARAQERSGQVRREHLGPVVEREVGDPRSAGVGAGVVHQDRHRTEHLLRPREQTLDLRLDADVGLRDDGSPADLLNLTPRLLGGVFVTEVIDDDRGAFARERDGARAADTGPGAGDEGDAPGELRRDVTDGVCMTHDHFLLLDGIPCYAGRHTVVSSYKGVE